MVKTIAFTSPVKIVILAAMTLSHDEEQRYARHFSLPGVGRAGQEKLKSSKVLIVGAGGLGSPVSLYLAAAGVGHLTVIDPDQVSLSNLQRQILFSSKDISQPKALKAQEKLQLLNPAIHVEAIQASLTSENALALIQEHDLVIDGSDNFSTRYCVNDVCILASKPLVFGALSRFDAQVSVFHSENGPCYRCLYPTAPPLEAIQNCSEAGVLGALAGTVGTLMATEALKILLGIGKTLSGRMLIYDSLNAQFFNRVIEKNLDCAACGPHAAKTSMRPNASAQENTSQIENGLSWSEFNTAEVRAQIIDVRTPEEFFEEALPRSQNIPLGVLSSNIESYVTELAQHESVILICQSGKRSARALELLKNAGLRNIQHIQGGLHDRPHDHFLSERP